MRQVSLWVKCDGLVARVVACHVALATIDAHFLINNCDCLLFVVQAVVVSDARKGETDHILVQYTNMLGCLKRMRREMGNLSDG